MMRNLSRQWNRCFNTSLWLMIGALATSSAALAEWKVVISTPNLGTRTHFVMKSNGLSVRDEEVTGDIGPAGAEGDGEASYTANSTGHFDFQDYPTVNPFQGKMDFHPTLTAKLTWVGGGEAGGSGSSGSSAPPKVIYVKEVLDAGAGGAGPTRKRDPYNGEVIETPLNASVTAELGGGDFQVTTSEVNEGDHHFKSVVGRKITRYEVPKEPNSEGNIEIIIQRSPRAMVSATGWQWGTMSSGVSWDVKVATFNIGSDIEPSRIRLGRNIPFELPQADDNKFLHSVAQWNPDERRWEGGSTFTAYSSGLYPDFWWSLEQGTALPQTNYTGETSWDFPGNIKSFLFDLGPAPVGLPNSWGGSTSTQKPFPQSVFIKVEGKPSYDPTKVWMTGFLSITWHLPYENWTLLNTVPGPVITQYPMNTISATAGVPNGSIDAQWDAVPQWFGRVGQAMHTLSAFPFHPAFQAFFEILGVIGDDFQQEPTEETITNSKQDWDNAVDNGLVPPGMTKDEDHWDDCVVRARRIIRYSKDTLDGDSYDHHGYAGTDTWEMWRTKGPNAGITIEKYYEERDPTVTSPS